MTTESADLQSLAERFAALRQSLVEGQSVSETEIANVAEKIYSYIKVSPVSSLTRRALVLLSTAPPHPDLDPWRLKACGIEDMYARLIAAKPSSVTRYQECENSPPKVVEEHHQSIDNPTPKTDSGKPSTTSPASDTDEVTAYQTGLTSPDDVDF